MTANRNPHPGSPDAPVAGAPRTPPPRHEPSRAAPAPRRVLAQAAFELRTTLRNGEQLLLTLVLPVLILLGLTRSDLVDVGSGDRLTVVAPGVLALAVMSTAFTSQAITTAFDRRAGVLRLLATTPLGRSGLVLGKALGVLALELVQLVVLGGVAGLLGWRPDPSGTLPALLALVLGTLAFSGLALLMAGVLRAEAVLALANLVWVLLLVGGAVILPATVLPGPLAAVAPWLPSGALGDALRSALTDGTVAEFPLLVLTGWSLLLGAGIARFARWS